MTISIQDSDSSNLPSLERSPGSVPPPAEMAEPLCCLWPDEDPRPTLTDDWLLAHLPSSATRILLVGLGPETLPRLLAQAGHRVTAVARTWDFIAPARGSHAAPNESLAKDAGVYAASTPPWVFEAIISRGSLRGCTDLDYWFREARRLLAPDGRLILCEEVSYEEEPDSGAVEGVVPARVGDCHEARAIEQGFGAHGFYVEHHEDWARQAVAACHAVLGPPQANTLSLDGAASLPGDALRSTCERILVGVETGRIGFEFWVLAPSDFIVRGYRPGDEYLILATFNQVFQTSRTLEHWRWKYLDNPYGQAWITLVLDGDRLAAHYASYPVPLYVEHALRLGCQAADAFSVPSYRKVGHGATALMSRAFRHFERSNCEARLAFGHGFNVNKIQKLGRRFWRHQVPAPVYQRILDQSAITRYRAIRSWRFRWRGYSLSATSEVGDWADQIFATTKDDYGWLVARDKIYLTWRYQLCPDVDNLFLVIYHFGEPIGWMVGRIQDQTWLIGDALFRPRHAKTAFLMALNAVFRQHPEIKRVDSWFSEVPNWLNRILDSLGFIKQRQFQDLDLVVRFYRARLSAQDIAEHFYFTWGDSDLY